MTIAREEIFGPVLSVLPYDRAADAIAIANDSQCGLAGGIWSANTDHALEVARKIRTGTIASNGADPDFSAPFGGTSRAAPGANSGAPVSTSNTRRSRYDVPPSRGWQGALNLKGFELGMDGPPAGRLVW